MTDLVPLAVRAHTTLATDSATPPRKRSTSPPRRDPARRPASILVFDCETTTGPDQALLVGCYRSYELTWSSRGPTLECVAEGLFHADELATRAPEGLGTLKGYARGRPSAAGHGRAGATRRLGLLSRADFVKKVLFPALEGEATVVMFNAPFDLSRLATGWGTARGPSFGGGFSFPLLDYEDDEGVRRENRYAPRVRVRLLDSRRALLGLASARPASSPDAQNRQGGSFLDLRTLAFALTGNSHSLESGCDAFSVPYSKQPVVHGTISEQLVDCCRDDVAATARLYRALAAEYERHDLSRPPTRVYSPASLAKTYLVESGVQPLLDRQPDFPDELLGYAMAAYYGGRAECRIRRIPVPVCYLDFASMYPTVSALMGLWRFLRCRRIETVEDDPAAVGDWLAALTVDDVFDPALWPRLCALALVEPNGEILPARARWTPRGAFGIGVNPLTSKQPLWYPLADLVAARLLGGRPPRVRRVIRLLPAGEAQGLRPFRIRGSRLIDPLNEDVFRALVEERRRLEHAGDPESLRTAAALKIVANAASYGIFVELNRQEPKADPTPVHVYGLSQFTAAVSAPEEPGRFFFPPFAALVTGAGRLMLALLERLVTDQGGAWAFADTDSMAIVANQHGGLVPCPGGAEHNDDGRQCVRALSWAQIDQIIARFRQLNPYDPDVVPGSILALEPENFDPETGARRQLHCQAVSAKRYSLFVRDDTGQPQIVKASEHALGGFYLNPADPDDPDRRDWVNQLWQLIIREDALGLPADRPPWLDRPALTRFTISHPKLLRPFATWNRGKPYEDQVKPGNLILIAHVTPGGYPPGAVPERFTLVAPFERNPAAWNSLPWSNVYAPQSRYRIDTRSLIDRRGIPLRPGSVAVKTYAHVLTSYRSHPEPKSLGPDGRPCTRNTIGLLSRRPVQALEIAHVGKEANLLAEISAGLIGDEEDALITYLDPRCDTFNAVRAVLAKIPASRLAHDTGLDKTTVKRIRSGRVQPSTRSRQLLTAAATAHAREQARATTL
jgi:hypothetical protein